MLMHTYERTIIWSVLSFAAATWCTVDCCMMEILLNFIGYCAMDCSMSARFMSIGSRINDQLSLIRKTSWYKMWQDVKNVDVQICSVVLIAKWIIAVDVTTWCCTQWSLEAMQDISMVVAVWKMYASYNETWCNKWVAATSSLQQVLQVSYVATK